MSKLVEYAESEMKRAGLYNPGSDYDGRIPEAVMALVKAHVEQGHSGASHHMVLQIFNRVINFQPLTPITSDPAGWMAVGDGFWQCVRNPNLFSRDGGKTWYDVDKPTEIMCEGGKGEG